MNTKPAVLGGTPRFRSKINIVRPVLPRMDSLSHEVNEIINTGMVTKGKYLTRFEEAVAEKLDVKHAIAVSSCTTGLMLIYQSLGLTGEVVVPSFTFMATVSSMIWAGLKPVYADVNPETTNLDPAAAEAAITPQTSAIVAVHNFGNPAEIEALQAIADKYSLKLIFDAAHGFGAHYRGKQVGGQGNAQAFSLSPTKLLIAGEGGIVSTNDDDLAAKIRLGREYGNDGSYDSAFAGINARMPEFNAILGYHHLNMLEKNVRHRNRIAGLFDRELSSVPGISVQQVAPGDRNSYKDYSVVIDEELFGLHRDELADALKEENVDTRKYYEPPVHRQTAYREYYAGQALPGTDLLAENSLSLPIWSDMPEDTAMGIVEAVKRIHQNASLIREQSFNGSEKANNNKVLMDA